VGEDGVTHHGVFDLAYLSIIPGMTVASPTTEEDLRDMIYTASEHNGPMAIRYPRGKVSHPDFGNSYKLIPIGKGRTVIDAPESEVAVVTIGPVGTDAKEVVERLREEGKSIALYDMLWLKPIDTEMLRRITERHPRIITIEDGTVNGGLGSAVAEYIIRHNLSNRITKMGVPDKWIHHGSVEQLRHICGYDKEGIRQCILNNLPKER
jgi:1-deoxy-D-xylulose-5-phosphate synthase